MGLLKWIPSFDSLLNNVIRTLSRLKSHYNLNKQKSKLLLLQALSKPAHHRI